MYRHGLRDDQFARIEKLLPGRSGYVGRSSDRGNQLFAEAVIWKFRTGVPWRDMPERFGAWKNLHMSVISLFDVVRSGLFDGLPGSASRAM